MSNPPGLYIDGLDTRGMRTPGGEKHSASWIIERVSSPHAGRARFEVPPERGYKVGGVVIDEYPIRFGGQLADRVRVRAPVLVAPADPVPRRDPCVP